MVIQRGLHQEHDLPLRTVMITGAKVLDGVLKLFAVVQDASWQVVQMIFGLTKLLSMMTKNMVVEMFLVFPMDFYAVSFNFH